MAIPPLIGWSAWLGFAAEYAGAALLIAAGIYLAVFFTVTETSPWARFLRPLRVIGLVLIGIGIGLACITYGKTLGATECNAAWREKNYEARIDRLNQQIEAKTAAAAAAQGSLKAIASEKDKADADVADYQVAVARLESAVASCRRATADDDRRLCQILGPAAAGCRPAR
jgi:xanthine/uracil permease